MNIYFSGVGGVGIGPLVQIALDAGYKAQGSDMNESPLTKELRDRGIAVNIGQDGTFLQTSHDAQPLDWFVYTSALPTDHPELRLANQLGIKTAKRDELLARIIEEKGLKLIAVAGTHGKTTTTGMLAWVFKELNIPVSYSVGATLSFGPSGKFDPASKYFVYECDEFDRNFLHFSSHISLITSVDYDHPDTYATEVDYLDAFRQFIAQSEKTIMWQADADVIETTSDTSAVLDNKNVLDVKLAGEHNRRNATLVVKAMEYLQLATSNDTLQALSRFPGTNRRFEKLGENIYSDYGHHPVEIAATLQMARELSDNVVLVYQPHQNVRQHEVQSQYTDCFTLAKEVYWLPTHLTRENPDLPILTPQELTKDIVNKDNLHIAELDDDLWGHIKQAQGEGKLVLAMGAGNIDSWLRQKLATDQSL